LYSERYSRRVAEVWWMAFDENDVWCVAHALKLNVMDLENSVNEEEVTL
jgi:hypothetical protein